MSDLEGGRGLAGRSFKVSGDAASSFEGIRVIHYCMYGHDDVRGTSIKAGARDFHVIFQLWTAKVLTHSSGAQGRWNAAI
jgi:hypothetical protein